MSLKLKFCCLQNLSFILTSKLIVTEHNPMLIDVLRCHNLVFKNAQALIPFLLVKADRELS